MTSTGNKHFRNIFFVVQGGYLTGSWAGVILGKQDLTANSRGEPLVPVIGCSEIKNGKLTTMSQNLSAMSRSLGEI